MPAPLKPSASKLKPVMSTRLRPSLSAVRPAMPLAKAATPIITEKRLPAAVVESSKV